MDLQLHWQILLQTSAAVKGCIKLLPSEKKQTQKIAVADASGMLQVFGVKQGAFSWSFRQSTAGIKFTSVSYGRGVNQRDKLFVTTERSVRGMTKKGKEFYRLEPALGEKIQSALVLNTLMWVVAETKLFGFENDKQMWAFASPSPIICYEHIAASSGMEHFLLLGCEDGTVRVVNNGRLYFEAPLKSPVTALRFIREVQSTHVPGLQQYEFLYGCKTGSWGRMLLNSQGLELAAVQPAVKQAGAITALYSMMCFTAAGSRDLLVGREGGLLQVHRLGDKGDLLCCCEAQVGEAVINMESGCVVDADKESLVLHTYSGKILAYNCGQAAVAKMITAETANDKSKATNRLMALQSEVARLRATVAQQRDQYAALLQQYGRPLIQRATIKDTFVHDPKLYCWLWSLQCSSPIHSIAFQADAALTIKEADGTVGILSHSPPDLVNNNLTIATMRCQDSTSRVELHVYCSEGTPGSLRACVIPHLAIEVCPVLTRVVKPLCLHVRKDEGSYSRPDQKVPINKLKVTGEFTVLEMHGWLSSILPDVPGRPPAGSLRLVYVNTLLGTTLTCDITQHEATFTSELLPTLSILKDAITAEATAGRRQISVSTGLDPNSVKHVLHGLWAPLREHQGRQKRVKISRALKELKLQPADVPLLPAEYRPLAAQVPEQLLAAAAASKGAAQEHHQFLVDIVTGLLVCWRRLNGLSTAKESVQKLQSLVAAPQVTVQDVIAAIMADTVA